MNPVFTILCGMTLAMTLGVCIYLFISVKRDLYVVEARYLRRGENLRTQLKELADELEIVRREMEKMDLRMDPSVAMTRTLGSGTRIQALRMIKHGQGPEHISAALSLPRNEVELLIKVQRLMADQPLQLTTSALNG